MPEVRPIDANKLQEQLKRKTPEPGKRNYVEGFNDCLMKVKSMIHSAKPLDYEPVVRCKDCVHWKKEKLYIGNNNAVSSKCEWFSSYSTIVGGIYTHRNDFCSYGAKMDEEVKE